MDERIIDIFTDGGIFEGGKYAVSTAVINENRKNFTRVQHTSLYKTCTFAEILAIKKALSRLYGIFKQKSIDRNGLTINLFCDSKTTVNVLRGMFERGELRDEVHGEEIFFEIYGLFLKFNCPINVYHINSHIPVSKIEEYHQKFCESNHIDINLSTFKYLRSQNNISDLLVRRTYENKFLNSKEEKYRKVYPETLSYTQ